MLKAEARVLQLKFVTYRGNDLMECFGKKTIETCRDDCTWREKNGFSYCRPKTLKAGAKLGKTDWVNKVLEKIKDLTPDEKVKLQEVSERFDQNIVFQEVKEIVNGRYDKAEKEKEAMKEVEAMKEAEARIRRFKGEEAMTLNEITKYLKNNPNRNDLQPKASILKKMIAETYDFRNYTDEEKMQELSSRLAKYLKIFYLPEESSGSIRYPEDSDLRKFQILKGETVPRPATKTTTWSQPPEPIDIFVAKLNKAVDLTPEYKEIQDKKIIKIEDYVNNNDVDQTKVRQMITKVRQIYQNLTNIYRATQYLENITRKNFVTTKNQKHLIIYMTFPDPTFGFLTKEASPTKAGKRDLNAIVDELEAKQSELQNAKKYGMDDRYFVADPQLVNEIKILSEQYFSELAFSSDESMAVRVYKQDTNITYLKRSLEDTRKKLLEKENLEMWVDPISGKQGLDALQRTSAATATKFRYMDNLSSTPVSLNRLHKR